MGEQVAHGRALGPRRLVEVDHSLLGGDELGERRDELRHRSPAEDVLPPAMHRDDLGPARDTRGRMLRAPIVDLSERSHAAILGPMEKRLISSGAAFEDRVGYSRAVVAGGHVWVSGTAPIMPGDEDPPADAYGQARRCLEIVEAALAEAGASLEDVVRTRIYVTRADLIDEVGRAHREAFADARPATS